MATLVLSAAGMALGGSVGGSVLGISMAAIGRAAGAALGRSIDQQLLGAGSDPVEHGRVDRFRLMGASEGAPLERVYGRMRLGGQVIWASQFEEHASTTGGSGKGIGRPSPRVTELSYTVSLAIAICTGPITRVSRVWADGNELSVDQYTMRVYQGDADQQPDPKMEAVEGVGNVPAYAGVAYVVFEDLDVTQFGNRVPQFSFEVHRPDPAGQGDIAGAVQGVAMIPGTGEYALATQPVTMTTGFAETRVLNAASPSGRTDFLEAFKALEGELPQCGAVNLVVSWFGTDLRASHCVIRPQVEQTETDSEDMPWEVAGISRADASTVPRVADRPVYGGTPCDASVKQAIAHMRARGQHVTFYPFILMEQMQGNQLPDPWSDALSQPALPWRGRITTSKAPGQPGSPDQTAAARAEVDAFFDNPEGMRRFILHYAQICADAGGVDAFCIGSEMRGLTFIRDDQGYPAVDRLIALTREVRAILGPDCKIGYAADWSEYHGHQPGGGDKIFHLDPLWADADIDFVGIDNYMPLSDWRDGDDHADAEWGSIYNLEYLKANVAGGEMFDWYYHSPEARAAQIRTPITDGEGEPWIWRQKDLRGWWENRHHNRIGGVRASAPTAWQPGMKPIWFTEYGCAAIDKGTNQPNKFLDPKSSESHLPRFSNGQRDDYLQMQYLRAITEHFADDANNPVHPETGHRMVPMERAHVWAWDARPWPAFPGREDLWSDGGNYRKGHWLNGRATARSVTSIVSEICKGAGVHHVDTKHLHGLVRGYSQDDTDTARAALQPLMLAYGFDAIERDGALQFRTRDGKSIARLDPGALAIGEDDSANPEYLRAGQADVSGRARIVYVDSVGAYETRAAEAIFPGDAVSTTSGQELRLALTSGEAQTIAERWLAEARVARDRIRFALPPSRRDLGAGDVVTLAERDWRIDRVESAGTRLIEATRVERVLYERTEAEDLPEAIRPGPAVVPVSGMFMDLPLITGAEQPHAPHVAMVARPWPGVALLQSASNDADYALLETFSAPAIAGETLTDMAWSQTGLWDKGPALRVKLAQGSLQSVAPERLLYGANLAAIGDGSTGHWELFQFAGADLVDQRVYDLRFRLRGQQGSDAVMPSVWPAGSKFVLLNSALRQITVPPNMRGVARDYRWGPAARPSGDATWRHARLAFAGNGLRPYSVCHLRKETSPAGDTLRWIRRTRIDGDSWDRAEVPLGEAQEAYSVTIRVNGEIARQITVSVPQWTYTAADKAADGAGAGYLAEIRQLSDRYGPGPAKRLSG